MKLPSEETLWKTASIGFGLIVGVAIISIMHQVNYLLHTIDNSTAADLDFETMKEYFSHVPLLAGKLISLVTGTFFASAIAKLVKPNLTISSAVIIGSVLMILGLFDILSTSYPIYFKITAPILYIPAALFGYLFIKKIHFK